MWIAQKALQTTFTRWRADASLGAFSIQDHGTHYYPGEKVPWHCHSKVQDSFYILEGQLRIFLRDPKEEVTLLPGATCSVRPGRPHLVSNGGKSNATFLVLQGVGKYDFIALD